MTAFRTWHWFDQLLVVLVVVILIAGSAVNLTILKLLLATTFYVGVVHLTSYLNGWWRMPLEDKPRTTENWHLAAALEREGIGFALAYAFGLVFYGIALTASIVYVVSYI